MRAKGLLDPQLRAQLLADNTNRVRLQLLASVPAGKEPVLGLASAPVRAQDLQQLRRQHHLTRELALALANMDDHPLAVDVGDLKIERFLTAQALSLIHISEPTRLGMISYAVFCLKKKNQ